MNNEKVYQFDNYILGYDSGLKDRSCLTLCKIENENYYVLTSLYDESANLISSMLDEFQKQNKIKDKKLDAIKFYIEQSDIKNMLWGKEILKIIDKEEK